MIPDSESAPGTKQEHLHERTTDGIVPFVQRIGIFFRNFAENSPCQSPNPRLQCLHVCDGSYYMSNAALVKTILNCACIEIEVMDNISSSCQSRILGFGEIEHHNASGIVSTT